MKITITAKEIKTKDKTTPIKAHLCFRLRDKEVDIKVRSDIEVLAEYWDNDALAYRRTKMVSAEEQKRIKTLVKNIIDELNDSFDPQTADVTWTKAVIEKWVNPKKASTEGLTTVVSRIEQYITEHSVTNFYARSFKATIKKLQRYEAFKREMEGEDDFVLYCETIRPEDYIDFREYIINEYVYYDDYPEFYEQFNLGYYPPKQLSSTSVINTMHYLRIVGHWCIKMGFTTNRSCDAFTIPAAIHGTPFYLTLEERDQLFEADLSEYPKLELCRDLFVFQSLVGCRVGDLFRFTKDNIVGDLLEYMPRKTMKKTGQKVTVALNNKALAILKKYADREDTLFPSMQIQKYNERIRILLKVCGINRVVTVLNTTTGKEEQVPICDVASSHMARRNFIGNLYKKVKDPNLISSMTGHVNGSRAFARYREIDDDVKIELVNLIN